MPEHRRVRVGVAVVVAVTWSCLLVRTAPADIPANGDAWTESAAGQWSLTYGAGVLSNDASVFQVGANSLKYSVAAADLGNGAFQYNFSPLLNLSSLYPSGQLEFWAKLDAPTTGLAQFFGRIELQGPTQTNRAWHNSDLGLTASWQHFSLPFSTGWGGTGDYDPTQTFDIRFLFLDASRAFSVNIDGLKLSPIPEPTSLAVVAVAAMLCGRRRKH
jgi:hypothetical protein